MSCSCNKKTQQADPSEPVPTIKISGALTQRTWQALTVVKQIRHFRIEKKTIEGTTDQFSNKLNFVGELDTDNRDIFLARLMDDRSYAWTQRDSSVEFSPDRQYVLKGAEGNVNVLVDLDHGLLSFINLEGQKVLKMTKNLTNYFNDLQ